MFNYPESMIDKTTTDYKKMEEGGTTNPLFDDQRETSTAERSTSTAVTIPAGLSERLASKGHFVRVYCHNSLFEKKPKNVNGIQLIYTPSINSKVFSQLYNSFFSFIHVCFSDIDIILVVNSANGPFGILTKIFRKKTWILPFNKRVWRLCSLDKVNKKWSPI